MTFSIAAHCPRTGQFGVAATTAMPAVGKLVTHAAPGAGAVATQARLNPYLGIDGLSLLREGHQADQVVEILRGRDPRIELRQFSVVDGGGAVSSWTGNGCLDWAGAAEGEHFVVSGNRLTGQHVVDDAAAAMNASSLEPLAKRFIEALRAGVEAGGDRLGERSATIYIIGTEEYPLWDIRVDDHDSPLDELRRLYHVFARRLLPEIGRMPTRDDYGGALDEDAV